ncbi:MAG: alpha/beta hydrolase [Clostridia bacterium]
MIRAFKSEKKKQEVYKSYDGLLTQWDTALEEKDIKGRYGTTHIICAGDPNNMPLLLFHGVGDNSAIMWIYNAKEFAKEYYVIAVDVIGGAGKSVSNDTYTEGFDQIIWITELLDVLKLDKVYAAGVSYGCYLVQLFKCKLPERFIKIAGLAGGPASSEFSKPNSGLKSILIFLPEALFPTKSNCIRLLKKLTGDGGEAFIHNSLLLDHWFLLLNAFNNSSMMKHPVKPINKEDFNIPRDEGLFLIGDKDRIAYSEESIRASDALNINYMIIKGAGHSINHEQPELINRLIMEFLRC